MIQPSTIPQILLKVIHSNEENRNNNLQDKTKYICKNKPSQKQPEFPYHMDALDTTLCNLTIPITKIASANCYILFGALFGDNIISTPTIN